jgi:hypothetical protein
VLSRDKAKSAVQNIAAGGAQVLIAAFGVLAGTRYIFVPRTAYKLKGTVRPPTTMIGVPIFGMSPPRSITYWLLNMF